MVRSSGSRIPLHVITGFLGSGKTTVLTRLLQQGERLGVLVNEVGELGLEDALQLDEDVLLLAGGCVCCALREDLRATVASVLDRGVERIVLETTGLADPAPLLHTFATDAYLAAHLELVGVICVIDALRAEDLLAEHPEAQRQLDFADRVVVTKTDQADPQRLQTVLERLEGHEMRTADHGAVDATWLLRAAPVRQPRFWIPAVHTAHQVHRVSHEAPVHLEPLLLWLRLVTQVDGPRLLRIKLRIRTPDGACWWVQSANRFLSPPLRLADSAGPGAEGMLVVRDGPTATLLTSLTEALSQIP